MKELINWKFNQYRLNLLVLLTDSRIANKKLTKEHLFG